MDPFDAMIISEVGVAHDADTFDGPVYADKVIGKKHIIRCDAGNDQTRCRI